MSRQMQKNEKKPQGERKKRVDKRARFMRIGACSLAGLLAGIMLLSFVFSALPAKAAASQSSINALKDKLSTMGDEKKQLETEIKTLKADKSALSAQIKKIDRQIVVLTEEIEVQNELIAELDEMIELKTIELADSQQRQDDQYIKMRDRVRFLVENGNLSYLQILLSADDFFDFLTRYEIIGQVSTYEQQMFEELRAIKEDVAEQKLSLEEHQAEQVTQLAALEQNKKALDAEQASRDKQMKDLETAEGEAKKAFNEIEAEEDRVNAEIKRQVAELAAKSTYVGGTFLWPLPAGYTTITSPYGMRNHPVTGVSKLHTGVDFRLGKGVNIVAANSGTGIVSD